MTYLQTLAAAASVIVPLVALQTFWIARSIDSIRDELGGHLDRVDHALDGVRDELRDARGELRGIRTDIGSDRERIARLETR